MSSHLKTLAAAAAIGTPAALKVASGLHLPGADDLLRGGVFLGIMSAVALLWSLRGSGGRGVHVDRVSVALLLAAVGVLMGGPLAVLVAALMTLILASTIGSALYLVLLAARAAGSAAGRFGVRVPLRRNP